MQTPAGVEEIASYADEIGPHVPLLFDGEGGPSDMVVIAKLRSPRFGQIHRLEGVNFRQLHEKYLSTLRSWRIHRLLR